MEWKGEAIIVSKEIRVDPPYGSKNCQLIQNVGGDEALKQNSLDRVKRIVDTV